MTVSTRRIEAIENELAEVRKDLDEVTGMLGIRQMTAVELKNIRVFFYISAFTFAAVIQVVLILIKFLPGAPLEYDNLLLVLLTVGNLFILFVLCVLINRYRGSNRHSLLSRKNDRSYQTKKLRTCEPT